MNPEENRLQVVDALRGFAIVSIMLLHNIEHFDFIYSPAGLPDWMVNFDKGLTGTMYFLFGGKAYAIFALLFGLTFFIQSDNQAKKGRDFRGRFAWRLVLLLLFGIVNSAFYEGDILSFYAVLGFFIIPVAKLSTRTVFWIALFLMLQPFEWFNVIRAVQNPDLIWGDPLSWSYFGKIGDYLAGDSLIKTWAGNLTNGKMAVVLWSWEQGRVFQTVSLFMFGMLAGRKELFVTSEKSRKFWLRTLIIASVSFIILFHFRNDLFGMISNTVVLRPLRTVYGSYSNMAFMLVLVSGFVLLFRTKGGFRSLNIFSSMGRMSLSNYIMQSVMGSFIYYGFGLGLYQYTGALYSLVIGILLALLQGFFSAWWMRHHRKGPLETVWHYATWAGYKNPG